jgi:hypothetical protein
MILVQKTISPSYDLEIKINKKDIFVGEDILFNLKFKYKKDMQIVDLNFFKPDFSNFWTKELKSNKQTVQGDFVIHELNYLLFPQKDGKLDIEPLRIDAVVIDNKTQGYGFFSSQATKSIPIYSNRLSLNIKPLPQNCKLIGDFEIYSTIDKNSIKEGEAISYNLTIKGRGNVDDIDEIKLIIPNATIYDNPSQKEFDINNGLYGGIFSKTYSIVSQNSFVIPEVSLKYFDKKTNKVKVIKTKSYNIKVKGAAKKAAVLEVAKPKEKLIVNSDKKDKIITKTIITTDNQKIIFFIFGMIASFILMSLYFIFKNKTKVKDEVPLEKLIKKTKSSQELLKLLVVYINIDSKLDKIIYNLENRDNLVELKIIKKKILDILKDRTLQQKL